MIIKVLYKNGGKEFIRLIGKGEVKKIYLLKEPLNPKPKKDSLNFTGLWFTDEGKFIEVTAGGEAYLLQEDGLRHSVVQLNSKGFCDNIGNLLIKQRGDEQHCKEFAINWPVVRKKYHNGE